MNCSDFAIFPDREYCGKNDEDNRLLEQNNLIAEQAVCSVAWVLHNVFFKLRFVDTYVTQHFYLRNG